MCAAACGKRDRSAPTVLWKQGKTDIRRAEDTVNQIFWYYKDDCRTEIPNISYNQRNLDVLSKCFYRAFQLHEIHTWPRRAWQGCRMLSQRWHCSNAHRAQPLLSHDPAMPRSISEVQKEKSNEALQNIHKEKLLCDQETPFKLWVTAYLCFSQVSQPEVQGTHIIQDLWRDISLYLLLQNACGCSIGWQSTLCKETASGWKKEENELYTLLWKAHTQFTKCILVIPVYQSVPEFGLAQSMPLHHQDIVLWLSLNAPEKQKIIKPLQRHTACLKKMEIKEGVKAFTLTPERCTILQKQTSKKSAQ